MSPKLPPPPASVLAKINFAERPPKFPRGYFDSLVSPTRELLDRGLSVAQAADWWVREGVFPTAHRQRFMDAMRNRLSRLRQRIAQKAEVIRWRASPYYDSVHALGNGRRALCGAETALWVDASSTAMKCARCVGLARRQGISIADS